MSEPQLIIAEAPLSVLQNDYFDKIWEFRTAEPESALINLPIYFYNWNMVWQLDAGDSSVQIPFTVLESDAANGHIRATLAPGLTTQLLGYYKMTCLVVGGNGSPFTIQRGPFVTEPN